MRLRLRTRASVETPKGARRPKAAVVGGGWAGFGAAWNLSKAGWDVTLVDASPSPGGVAGKGKAGKIELGIKGCWYHYRNIEKLLAEIGVDIEDAYGDFAETGFYSERGLEVVSPVFSKCKPRLPAPLGPLAYTSDRFTDLPLVDRLTAFPLSQALLEFDLDEDTYAAYDKVSFEDLCTKANVSSRLYQTFLKPILLALLFVPPSQLSAAAALSVLNNYVLAHQPDFDVRWPRRPPSEIFLQWKDKLEQKYGTTFISSSPVRKILHNGRAVTGVEIVGERTIEAEAVVLATGAFALPKIIKASEGLENCLGLKRVSELSCSAVTAVRFAIDGAPRPLKYASNVFSGPRENTAGTFYDIGALRGEESGRVFEVDTYNANALMDFDDRELEAAAKEVLSLEDPEFCRLDTLEVEAVKVRNAAFRWIPGSHGATPAMKPAGAPRGLYIAGDLVKNGPGEFEAHLGARGLSQEKSLVTGLQAGVLASEDFGVVNSVPKPEAVEPDEPHIQALKDSLRRVRSLGLRQLLV